jgi:hypothetical protein
MAQVTESDYETARKGNAKVRQEFLEAVDLEDARDFVGRVIYKKISKRDSWATTFPPTFFRKKSRVEVYGGIFNNIFEGFMSIFLDHEGYHAIQEVERRKTILEAIGRDETIYHDPFRVREYIGNLKESLAFASQIQNAEKRGLDTEIKSYLTEKIVESLLDAEQSLPHRNIVQDLRYFYCSFPRDKWSRENFPKILEAIHSVRNLNFLDDDNLVRQHFGINY